MDCFYFLYAYLANDCLPQFFCASRKYNQYFCGTTFLIMNENKLLKVVIPDQFRAKKVQNHLKPPAKIKLNTNIDPSSTVLFSKTRNAFGNEGTCQTTCQTIFLSNSFEEGFCTCAFAKNPLKTSRKFRKISEIYLQVSNVSTKQKSFFIYQLIR